jgi:glyoxylase-like metal-dependent hydrolase (beta-lactamase superfamily II)
MGGGAAAHGRWSPREWIWDGVQPYVDDVFGHIEAWRTPPEWPRDIVSPDDAHDPLVVEILGKPRTPVRTAAAGKLGDPRPVAFGEVVTLGPWALECVDARGHDPLHCAWYERSRGWLLSGDTILATPVPLVASMGDSVGQWLATLDRWERELEVSWLLPGHGMPTRLFGASLERSRSWLGRLHEAVRAQLAEREVVGALDVTRAVLPRDGSRFAARSAIVLATTDTILRELTMLGVVEEVAQGRWRAHRAVPDLDALEAPPR